MKTATTDSESSHDTGIEWTHHLGFKGVTWNPLVAIDKETGQRGWFCTHVSSGCRNCYAEKLNVEGMGGAFGTGHEYKYQNLKKIRFEERGVDKPIRWQKPRCAFVNSMTDLFHEKVPKEIIDRTFAAMALAPAHRFLILTKRPSVMNQYLSARRAAPRVAGEIPGLIEAEHQIDEEWAETRAGRIERHETPWPPKNVWIGVSAEDQSAANDRIPTLLSCPGAVRFVSVEPILGPVDLTGVETKDAATGQMLGFNVLSENKDEGLYFPHAGETRALDWVIAGGESGPEARPPHPRWFTSLRDQCLGEEVPFFFKQWGAWSPISSLPDPAGETARDTESRAVHTEATGSPRTAEVVTNMYFIGKDAGTDDLRGKTYREIPDPQTKDPKPKPDRS
jgi:protein gp37